MGKRSSEVKTGFRRAGGWLLGLAWLGLVFAGLAIAFTPSSHSPVLGWVLLSTAAIIAIATMDHWIKVFPALLAYGVLGSILTLVDGHVVNHPEVRVSRTEAVFMIVFFAITATLSFTFARRHLHVWDRIAVVVFILCFFWQAVAPNLMRLALGIGFTSLLLAWVYDRIQNRRAGPGSHRNEVPV